MLLLIPFAVLLLAAAIDWLLSFRYDDEMRPARFVVTQGPRTFQVESEEQVAELARTYRGVTRVERRCR